MGRTPSVDISEAVISKIINEYNTVAKATVPYLAKKYNIGVYVLNRRMKKEGVIFFKSGSQANRAYENLPSINRKRYPQKRRRKIIDTELKKQNYQCAICETTLTEITANLDHCHKSGQYRAFLCYGCNIGLGMFKDNRKALANAISYLDKHNPRLNYLQKLKLK